MSQLIGSVAVTPEQPRPGQSFTVRVLDPHGQPLQDSGAEVTVNGRPSGTRHLQYARPGEPRLTVRATHNGASDQKSLTVTIAGAPQRFVPSAGRPPELTMLRARQVMSSPYLVEMALGDPTVRPHLDLSGVALPSGNGIQMKGEGRLAAATLAAAKNPPEVLEGSLTGGATPSSRKLTAAVADLGDTDVTKLLPIPAAHPTYQWDFGDGSPMVTTESPVVQHDFFAGIDHVGSGQGQFDVACTIAHAGLTVRRTLTVHSAYHLCRQRGTVVPHAEVDILAAKRYTWFAAGFTVFNVEDSPMVLDRMAIAPVPSDPNAPATPPPFTVLRTPVVIPAKSSAWIGVHTPMHSGPVPYDAPAFAVWYAGHVDDLPVRFNTTFEVPIQQLHVMPELPRVPDDWTRTWPWDLVEKAIDDLVRNDPFVGRIPRTSVMVDERTGTVAVALKHPTHTLAPSQLRAAVRRIADATFAPVRALEQKPGGHSRPLPTLRRLDPGPGQDPNPGPEPQPAPFPKPGPGGDGCQPGPVVEGEVCDPENIDDPDAAQADAAQLVCQLTEQHCEAQIPGRFVNARKGDLILSPGAGSLIAEMMRKVEPDQKYSHSGIMTRNYDELTHSTASQKWLLDHQVGFTSDGSDGFDPMALKYLWPGVVRQSVEAAIRGEKFPEKAGDGTAKNYWISSFEPHQVGATYDGQFEIVPPLVVKPDPMLETEAIRQSLHAVANEAREGAGRPGVESKSHYRFYCYTNPAIALTDVAPAEAGWAAGTFPSVCSSYIWNVHHNLRSRLEGPGPLVTDADLEDEDKEKGAQTLPGAMDGLYKYTAGERLAAGEWLYDEIYNTAFDEAGWFGVFLTDAADDVANQVLNAFAHDDADGKDSEAWRSASDASAVSPDNLIWWDGPDKGGLYGLAEPLQYREPRKETFLVSRWRKVLGWGAIQGRIMAAGKPVPGAIVRVHDGKGGFTHSEADGGFRLEKVALGPYQLRADKQIEGVHMEAIVKIDHQQEITDVGDVVLQPPPDDRRLAKFTVDFWGSDYENFDDNEILDPGPEYFELEVSPDKPKNSRSLEYKWGGEMRMEYQVIARLLANEQIEVEVNGDLYEGTSESTEDLDGSGQIHFMVPKNQAVGAVIKVHNTDEDDEDDRGELTLTVTNAPNTV